MRKTRVERKRIGVGKVWEGGKGSFRRGRLENEKVEWWRGEGWNLEDGERVIWEWEGGEKNDEVWEGG